MSFIKAVEIGCCLQQLHANVQVSFVCTRGTLIADVHSCRAFGRKNQEWTLKPKCTVSRNHSWIQNYILCPTFSNLSHASTPSIILQHITIDINVFVFIIYIF